MPNFINHTKRLIDELLRENVESNSSDDEDLENQVTLSINNNDLSFLQNNIDCSTTIDNLTSTPIAETNRARGKLDLIPSEEFTDLFTHEQLTTAAASTSSTIDNSAYARSTVKLFEYAERRYYSFLQEMKTKFPDFARYQVTVFPLKKLTLQMYLYWLRVDMNYSYTTISSTFCYGFFHYIQTTKNIDTIAEHRNTIKLTLKALLRKFGNQVFKVEPLMNVDLNKLRDLCNQKTEKGSRLDCFLAQGRARGLRGDSWAFVQLHHLTWKKVVVGSRIRICLNIHIIKDKRVLHTPWKQNLNGWNDIGSCPNIALLIYLADHRKVMQEKSAALCIIRNNFLVKDDHKSEYLFTKESSLEPWTSKNMSNAVKTLSDKLQLRYTVRSFRSGLVVTCLLRSRLKNNGLFDDRVVETLVNFVNWKEQKSVKPYDRWITQHFSNINALQNEQEENEAAGTVRQLAVDLGYLESNDGQSMDPITIFDSNSANRKMNDTSNDSLTEEELMQLIYRKTQPTTEWKPSQERIKVPRAMKEYYMASDKDLEARMVNDKSSCQKVWSAFWKKACLRAATTIKEIEKDEQYRSLKEKKDEVSKSRMINIRKAYGHNKLVREFFKTNPLSQSSTTSGKRKRAEKSRASVMDESILSKENYIRELKALTVAKDRKLRETEDKYADQLRKMKEKYKKVKLDDPSDDSDT